MEKKKRKRRRPAKKAGPKTHLTEEILVSIKELILEGYTHPKIYASLGIPFDTWHGWKRRNQDNFVEKLITYDHEYKLKLAEHNLKEVMGMKTTEPVIGIFGPVLDKKTKKPVMRENDRLMKIKTDVSIFVAETLGRKDYSKKTEIDDVSKKKLIILKEK